MTAKRSISLAALLLLAFGVWLSAAGPVRAQEAPAGDATTPPKEPVEDNGKPGTDADPDAKPDPAPPALTVRELLVLQSDRYGEKANDPFLVDATYFNRVSHRGRSKRVAEGGGYDDGPMPLGLLTFEGRIEQAMRVQVKLPKSGSQLHAHWPNDATKSATVVDWFQIQQASDAKRQAWPIEPSGHWLEPLRQADDRLWLNTRDPVLKERFMLYDPSFRFNAPLLVTEAGKALQVSTTDKGTENPAFTLLLQHVKNKGWASAHTGKPWEGESTTLTKDEDFKPEHRNIRDALKPLAQVLGKRGYNPQEIDAALGMVASAGLREADMTLVYLLPEGQIDESVQLRFAPVPDRVIRTPIVVVNNVNPRMGDRLEKLIAQLGSDDWLTRDRAQRELIRLGKAAQERVKALHKHEDPEVAFRARAITQAYELLTEERR